MSNYAWATDRETKYSVCTVVFLKKSDPQNGCEYKGLQVVWICMGIQVLGYCINLIFAPPPPISLGVE